MPIFLRPMKTKSLLLSAAATLVLTTIGWVAFAATPEPQPNAPAATPAANAGLLQRGDYLVNRVGLCIDCHSPRNERGEHIPELHLRGAPIGVAPLAPMPWATAAPPLAGMPAGWSEKALAHFLMTGERPFNLPPVRPPMPPYRMDEADAKAVVAYLHSLAPRDATVAADAARN